MTLPMIGYTRISISKHPIIRSSSSTSTSGGVNSYDAGGSWRTREISRIRNLDEITKQGFDCGIAC